MNCAGNLRARQSRLMSLVEAVTNVVVGFLLALATQVAAFPMFGLHVSMEDNVLISCMFTAVSVMRSFILRRVFEAFRTRVHRRSEKKSLTA